MIKKKRNNKRIFALLGVIVIVVSLFAFPASAWQLTDIPFYNYFNCDAFKPTQSVGTRTDIAQINSTDVNNGYIYMYANFDGSNSPYVPTSYTNVTLRDACPELQIGQTYVISGEETFDYNGSDIVCEIFPSLVLVKSGANSVRWNYGEPLTITEDLLDYKIMLYAGKCISGDVPSPVNCSLRIWINKNQASEFASYNILKDLNEDAYQAGYQDARKDMLAKSDFLSAKNCVQVKFGWSNNTNTYYTENILYPFNGYFFSTNGFNSAYYVPPNGAYLDEISAIFDLRETDTEFYFGQFPLMLTASGCRVRVYMFTESGGEPSVIVDGTASPKLVDLTSLFQEQHSIGEKIEAISIIAYAADEYSESSVYNPAFFCSITSGDSNSYEYKLGYDAGYDAGTTLADKLSYDRGYKEGHDKGYTLGHTEGYDSGHEDGYYDGIYESDKPSFTKMVSAVVDVPVRAFKSLFNFEILGVDMQSFSLAIITLSLIVAVIKKII